jgi:bacterioferritin-associated ferredoxin
MAGPQQTPCSRCVSAAEQVLKAEEEESSQAARVRAVIATRHS